MAAEQFKVSCDITPGQVEEILHQQDKSWQAKSCDFVSEMARHELAWVVVTAKKARISSLELCWSGLLHIWHIALRSCLAKVHHHG